MSCRCGRGWWSLGLTTLVIVIVWTCVLPWIGSRQSVRARIEHLDRLGIDAAALYYTDLEVMHRLESDVAAIRQAHPDAFWSIHSVAE